MKGSRGSIVQKGANYYAVIAIGPRRKWFKGGKTKKAAQNVLNEKLGEIATDTYKEIPNVKFTVFARQWLKNNEPNLKPSTLELYEIIIEKHLVLYWPECKLDSIRLPMIQDYISARAKQVGAKTIRNEVAVIKSIFKYAIEADYLKTNPSAHVKKPRVEKNQIDLLEPTEIKLLIANATEAYRTAFMTAAYTGLRAGELWGLQWGDVDWNSCQIHIRRSLWKGEFQTPKSKSSIRRVDIPSFLISELKKWKIRCPINEDDLAFPNTDGKASNHYTVFKNHFHPALRRAGLRNVSFHSLRHSNASMRIQYGQNIKYLSTQLGHASIDITMDRYGHLFSDKDFIRGQVELLDASVRKPLETGKKEGSEEIAVNS
jgi:integrase